MPLPAPDLSKKVLNLFSLKNKAVIITGSSRGIGLEVAKGIAEAGGDVALIYSSAQNTEDEAAKISITYGVKCLAYKCDVTNFDILCFVNSVFDQIKIDFGKVDVVIANSGICTHVSALVYSNLSMIELYKDNTPEQWKQIQNVNLNGAFYTAQAAGKIFRQQGHGNLIFTASISGSIVNRPQPQAAYNASKAGVIHLAKSLAMEWIHFARVNTLSPGYISTDMASSVKAEWRDKWHELIPAMRMADPAELKGVCHRKDEYK